tara:strand:+ start:805 stop:2049 length:1245 start_codon:yes stop_codon:yes gene_type:complete
MKVILITNSNHGAGAPKAAKRLHESLLLNNCDSKIWVNNKHGDDERVIEPSGKFLKTINILKLYLSIIFVKLLKTNNEILHSPQIFSSPYWLKAINESDADIVHLHWFQKEMISISDLSKIKKPIVWTLHDMWGFCGAEHYSYDNRWNEGYLKSNRPIGEGGLDLNMWTWKRKKKYWKKPIQIIAPSHWMKESVNKSLLMKEWPVSVIPNPINIDVWNPVDKKIARDLINLPKDLDLILFGAASGTKSYIKGFDLLHDAIIKMGKSNNKKQIGLVIFGQSKPKNPPKYNFPVFYLGYLNDILSLKTAYSAADLLVIPSRLDNLPNMGVEANACGTPIVAFNNAGLPSIIKNKHNGYLAKPFDVNDLLKGIYWVLDSDREQLKKNCINHVLDNFESKKIALEHVELYKKIIKRLD